MALPELFANPAVPGTASPLTTIETNLSEHGTTMVTSAALSGSHPLAQSGQFRILVEQEYMIVTGSTASTKNWTVSRGAEGSAEVAHLAGKQIVHLFTAGAVGNQSDPAPEIPGIRTKPSGHFGDGSDGVMNANGTLEIPAGFTVFGTVPNRSYIQIRDIYPSEFTVASGITLYTNNFRIYCSGTFKNSGTIRGQQGPEAGGNAAGTAGGNSGSAAAAGTLSRSHTGSGGGNAGEAGKITAATAKTTTAGGLGGKGGAGVDKAGGTVKSPEQSASNGWPARSFYTAYTGQSSVGFGGLVGGSGGTGGGGGIVTTGGGGGAGGNGGGVIVICASVFDNKGTISAVGGIGGNGATGSGGTSGGGGGGGAGGGAIYYVYQELVEGGTVDTTTKNGESAPAAPVFWVGGGKGGTAGTNGTAGEAGAGGIVVGIRI